MSYDWENGLVGVRSAGSSKRKQFYLMTGDKPLRIPKAWAKTICRDAFSSPERKGGAYIRFNLYNNSDGNVWYAFYEKQRRYLHRVSKVHVLEVDQVCDNPCQGPTYKTTATQYLIIAPASGGDKDEALPRTAPLTDFLSHRMQRIGFNYYYDFTIVQRDDDPRHISLVNAKVEPKVEPQPRARHHGRAERLPTESKSTYAEPVRRPAAASSSSSSDSSSAFSAFAPFTSGRTGVVLRS